MSTNEDTTAVPDVAGTDLIPEACLSSSDLNKWPNLVNRELAPSV
jgi:hypothetical protein